MTNLYEPPPQFTLPVSRGGDLYFGFVYKPLIVDVDGEPVLDAQGNRQYAVADYPVDSSVQLVIETADPDTPITSEATIEGSVATVWEDKAVADTVLKGKLWRVVLSFSDGFDQVICNGTIVRADGK